MEKTLIENIKVGEYFKKKPDGKTVYIRDKYVQGMKKYECYKFDDVNDLCYLKKGSVVYIGFTF